MFSNVLNEHRHTLAFRLTLQYAGIFAASSMCAFAVVYFVIVSVVQARTDEDLLDDVEEFTLFYQQGGVERVMAEMDLEAAGDEADQTFLRLWTVDGRELKVTDLSTWQGLDAFAPLAQGPSLRSFELPDRDYGVRSVAGPLGPNLILQIGESLEADEEFIGAVLRGFLLTLASVVFLGGPIGWFMAKRALRGVRDVTLTATEIADGDLDRRVVVGSRGDELDALAEAFNKMLDRIQALIIGMREMTDNLAHDFRSPLARIRATAEMCLLDSEGGNWEAMAATTAEECDRLLEMINTTLDIAEAESGVAKFSLCDVDLVQLVREALDLFHPVAEDKEIAIESRLPSSCRAQGDLPRLQRALSNLIDNAVKYTPAGGRVTVSLVKRDSQVELSVEDTGIGLSVEECARIFDRFYRCDRSRSEQGNGLGLSLALAFVRAHGGTIEVRSELGTGSCFTIILPH